METALSTISVLPNTKKELQKFFKSAKTELLSGTIKNPLLVKVQLTYMKKLAELLLDDDDIDYVFLNEFTLYEAEKIIEINGAKLMQSEVGVKYEYSACGDPVWDGLDTAIKELAEKKKEREKFLQNIPHDNGVVDPDTGVFITKPPKSSKTKIKVIL